MNKLYIIGNVCKDPEIRTTQQGIQVCSFSVAVNGRKNKDGSENTQFFNISAWRNLAETCARYLQKGRKCAVIGPVSVREYEKKDGTKGFSLEVNADEVEFIGQAGENKAEGKTEDKAAASSKPKYTPVEVDDDMPF